MQLQINLNVNYIHSKRQIYTTNLAEPLPTWQQRWPAGRPACWGWSWGGWRCRAGCCRSRHRWCLARWPSAGTASWGQAEACTWVQGTEPQLAGKESVRVGCSAGRPLGGSTSWFCALQKRKQGWTRRGELREIETKGEEENEAIKPTQGYTVFCYPCG